MCRIGGIFHPKSGSLEQDALRMRDSMPHGGPDGAGIYLDPGQPLALVHRRLALIDLSDAGIQPMRLDTPSGSYHITFNGEIYNFRELRRKLEALGYRFRTRTDTEVILHAYDAWKEQCFARLNGMFALAIWDRAANRLVLARDHAGIKPLYYSLRDGRLVFASEIRAFLALDPQWPEDPHWRIPFLCMGHVPEPFTVLQGVQPLPKGHYSIIDLPSLQQRITRYDEYAPEHLIDNEAEAVAAVRETLTASVERQLFSDAPIGLFLSGGIDSSLLTLIAHPFLGDQLRTLSIVFEDAAFSEKKYQDLIVAQTKARHHSFLITQNDFRESLPDVLEAMDQPTIDGINAYFICKFARQYGLTAVLSGIGADEYWGGYPSFMPGWQKRLLKRVPAALLRAGALLPSHTAKRIASLGRQDFIGAYLFNRGFYSPGQTAELTGASPREVEDALSRVRFPGYPSGHGFEQASALETHLYMQNQLLRDTDCMSMWHSLEVRVPFLDKEMIRLAQSISPDVKQHPVTGKHLLVKAFPELPEAVWNRKKQGFAFPFNQWMKAAETRISNAQPDIVKNFEAGKIPWSLYWSHQLSQRTPRPTHLKAI